MAIEKTVCQATLRIVDSEARLREVGIEDLALVSEFKEQNPKDEEHAWYGVHMQGVRDAWVSRVQFRHFAGGSVMLGDGRAGSFKQATNAVIPVDSDTKIIWARRIGRTK